MALTTGRLRRLRSVLAKSVPVGFRKRIPLRVTRHLYPSGIGHAYLKDEPQFRLVLTGERVENEIFWRGLDGWHEGLAMS